MDVNQTLCDFIKQQNIVIENNINTICYRDFVYYANLIDGKGEQPGRPLELYNSTSTSAGNTINLQKFIHYITTYYDCKEPHQRRQRDVRQRLLLGGAERAYEKAV